MKPENFRIVWTVGIIIVAFMLGTAWRLRATEVTANQFIIEEYYMMGFDECIEWCNGYEGVGLQYKGKVITPFEKTQEQILWSYNMTDV